MTKKQIEASRLNGAKSRGPVTPKGKARSSMNATTHGLTAETVVLPGEPEARFFTLLESMLQAYAPATDYEVSLVEKMAALNWQQDRLLGIDTITLAIQMDIVEPALSAEVEDLSAPTLIALAYRDLADHSRVLPNLDRHASRIRRQFNQLRTELLALQKTRTAQKTEPQPSGHGPQRELQNEPTAPAPSNSDFSQKLQNEPKDQQTTAAQQHTSAQTVPGA